MWLGSCGESQQSGVRELMLLMTIVTSSVYPIFFVAGQLSNTWLWSDPTQAEYFCVWTEKAISYIW